MPPVKKVKPQKTKTLEEPAEKKKQTVISGQLSKKLLKAQKRQQKKERGVVLIKHLPHGFFETQLQKYFEQFGNVTRLRLVRSRRTGGSKGFAFVEFEYPEVAQVAAETMDNYLMFQKLVKSVYIPPEKQIYNFFKSSVRQVKDKAGKLKYVSGKTAGIQSKVHQHNTWDEESTKKRSLANLKKIKKLNAKFAHLGIDFSSILLDPKKLTEIEQDKNSVNESVPEVPEKKPKLAAKTAKKNLDIADLLGSTIAEDSEDEDWSGSELDENEIEAAVSFMTNQDDSESSSDAENCDDNDTVESANSEVRKTKKPVNNKKSVPEVPEKRTKLAAKTAKKQLAIADLLGNTIAEDSEDEDWSGSELDENEIEEDSSDEENCDDTVQSENSEVRRTKKPVGKAKISVTQEDRFNNLVKRKPQSGGILKKVKKLKQPTPILSKTAKNSAVLSFAKEMAKPFSKMNHKPKNITTKKKNLIKIK